MRRTYISPEYKLNRVYGTFNMKEESNFFSSKMLDIEDKISISTLDIIYYENLSGEQIDLSVESSSNPKYYSPNKSKLENHTLIVDGSQSPSQREGKTRWILTINVEKILDEYLFAIMKKFRSFEGIKNEMVRSNNVNIALMEYIKNNVYDRYGLESIDLYIKNRDLRDQNVLRWRVNWDPTVIGIENKFIGIQTESSVDGSQLKVTFNQSEQSSRYSFDYFFNLNFKKR